MWSIWYSFDILYKNREVNSKRFDNAEQLQNYIAETEGSIVFKLAVKIDQPEPIVAISPFMKAYFTYRPDRDNFLERGGKYCTLIHSLVLCKSIDFTGNISSFE